MSSLVRRLQVRLLKAAAIPRVPVRRHATGPMVGARHRLCSAHIGYLIDGTPLFEAAKPRRAPRKKASVMDKAPSEQIAKVPRKSRAKKVTVQ